MDSKAPQKKKLLSSKSGHPFPGVAPLLLLFILLFLLYMKQLSQTHSLETSINSCIQTILSEFAKSRVPLDAAMNTAIAVALVLYKVRRGARLDSYRMERCPNGYQMIQRELDSHGFSHIKVVHWGRSLNEPLLVDMSYKPNKSYVSTIHSAYDANEKITDLDPLVSLAMGKLLGYHCKYWKSQNSTEWRSRGSISFVGIFSKFPNVVVEKKNHNNTKKNNTIQIQYFGFGCSRKDTSVTTFEQIAKRMEKKAQKANRLLVGKVFSYGKKQYILGDFRICSRISNNK
jgi:hypothetical protein